MYKIAIQCDLLQDAMRRIEDGHPRRFINTATLHPHKPVFDHIDQPNSIAAANLIKRLHDLQLHEDNGHGGIALRA